MRKNMGLYRGKRKDTGVWVHGSLFVGFGKTYICPKAIAMYYFDGALCLGGFIEVDPETVAQYTGHTDVKRKKIYEGDIVQRYKTEFTPPRKYKNPFVVHIKFEFPCAVEEYYSAFEHYTEKVCYEIIGNIHDNPELLEVSK